MQADAFERGNAFFLIIIDQQTYKFFAQYMDAFLIKNKICSC
jgi:hypothetical protein